MKYAYTPDEHDEVYAVMLALNTDKVAYMWNEAMELYSRLIGNKEERLAYVFLWVATRPGFNMVIRDGFIRLTYFGKQVYLSDDE